MFLISLINYLQSYIFLTEDSNLNILIHFNNLKNLCFNLA